MIDVTCSSPEALEPRSIAAPDKRGLATTLSRLAPPSEFFSFAASEISRHHRLRRPAETTGKSSDPPEPAVVYRGEVLYEMRLRLHKREHV